MEFFYENLTLRKLIALKKKKKKKKNLLQRDFQSKSLQYINSCNIWNLLQRKSSFAKIYYLGVYYNNLH